MKVSVAQDDTIARLSIAGDMTIYSAGDLKQALLSASQGSRTVELNLANVTDLDTAGIQLLVLVKREADRDQKAFVIIEPSDAVRAVLDMYRMNAYLLGPTDSCDKECELRATSNRRSAG